MHLAHVAITVADLEAAALFYRDVLELPVLRAGPEVRVVLGSSELRLSPGPAYGGAHHLAFTVAPEDFAGVRAFAAGRLGPVTVDGSEVVEGPPGWDSRSVYFLGPEQTLLEYIAREHHRGRYPVGDPTTAPVVRALSEVGIGVPDVASAVRTVTRALRVPAYPPQEEQFAPVGDPDGLLVLVADGRPWFPSGHAAAARGPVEVGVAVDLPTPTSPSEPLRLSDTASLVLLPAGAGR